MSDEADFEGINFFGELIDGKNHFTKTDESTHDGDIDLDGSWAGENAGEHGDTLLGKNVGHVTTASVT